MAETDKSMQDLDNLFAAARAERPELPPHLAAAILADAAAVQPPQVLPAAVPARPSRWRQLSRAIGGWGGVSGLAAASAAGLWIGLAPPAFLPDPVQLAGLAPTAAESAALPYDSFDLAALLAEETQ